MDDILPISIYENKSTSIEIINKTSSSSSLHNDSGLAESLRSFSNSTIGEYTWDEIEYDLKHSSSSRTLKGEEKIKLELHQNEEHRVFEQSALYVPYKRSLVSPAPYVEYKRKIPMKLSTEDLAKELIAEISENDSPNKENTPLLLLIYADSFHFFFDVRLIFERQSKT